MSISSIHRLSIKFRSLFSSRRSIIAVCAVMLGVFLVFGIFSAAFAQQQQPTTSNVLGGLAELLGGAALAIATKPLVWSIQIISWISLHFGAFALNLGIGMLDTVVGMTSFRNVAIVNIGWKVSLDFVNLLFILILLVIGFATIFRKETYGIKALLPRLIIIALLINFSKVIAGVIIDAGNLLTAFFLHPGGGDQLKIGNALMRLLNIHKSLVPNLTFWADKVDIFSLTSGMRTAFAAMASATLIWVAAMGVWATALTFLVRIVALWLLIIFAPFGWIASILPGTRQYSNMWWQDFLRWVFVAPIMMFFLYLLAAFAAELDSQSLTDFARSTAEPMDVVQLLNYMGANHFLSSAKYISQFVVIMILILAGPIVANSVGAKGAAGVIRMAQVGQRWMLGQAAGMRPLAGWAARRGRERATPFMEEAATKLSQSRFARLPGVRQLVEAGMGAGAASRQRVQEARKDYAHESTHGLTTIARTMEGLPLIPENIEKRLAIAQELASRRDRSEQSEEDRKFNAKFIGDAIETNRARHDDEANKPLLAAQPQLAKDEDEKKRAVREAIRSDQVKNWDEDALSDPETVRILYKEMGERPEAMRELAKRLGERERNALLKGMKKRFSTGTKDEQFDSERSDLREAFMAIAPGRHLEAVAEYEQERDTQGNTTGATTIKRDMNGRAVINESFNKGRARTMSQQDLERFFQKTMEMRVLDAQGKPTEELTPEAIEQLMVLEEGRGVFHADETERAVRLAGADKDYTKNLKKRLDATPMDELLEEQNIKRASMYAYLTGDLSAFTDEKRIEAGLTGLAGKERDEKEASMRKQIDLEINNLLTSLDHDDAEEFGRKANDEIDKATGQKTKDRSQTREYVARYATASQLQHFLRGMQRDYRKEALEMAVAYHADDKVVGKKGEDVDKLFADPQYEGTEELKKKRTRMREEALKAKRSGMHGNYMRSLRRNPYIGSMALIHRIPIGAPGEYDDLDFLGQYDGTAEQQPEAEAAADDALRAAKAATERERRAAKRGEKRAPPGGGPMPTGGAKKSSDVGESKKKLGFNLEELTQSFGEDVTQKYFRGFLDLKPDEEQLKEAAEALNNLRVGYAKDKRLRSEKNPEWQERVRALGEELERKYSGKREDRTAAEAPQPATPSEPSPAGGGSAKAPPTAEAAPEGAAKPAAEGKAEESPKLDKLIEDFGKMIGHLEAIERSTGNMDTQLGELEKMPSAPGTASTSTLGEDARVGGLTREVRLKKLLDLTAEKVVTGFRKSVKDIPAEKRARGEEIAKRIEGGEKMGSATLRELVRELQGMLPKE